MISQIPDENSDYCEGCPFYHCGDDDPDDCSNPALKTGDVCGGQRTNECLETYPLGGTVTIEAKPSFRHECKDCPKAETHSCPWDAHPEQIQGGHCFTVEPEVKP